MTPAFIKAKVRKESHKQDMPKINPIGTGSNDARAVAI
jgi:hypothetical protein